VGVVTARPSRLLRRLPLLALALVALVAGLWAGLLRLGLDLPRLRLALAAEHGRLLVLDFLGTQIGRERAVALCRGSGTTSSGVAVRRPRPLSRRVAAR
jgi:hypothetical protein